MKRTNFFWLSLDTVFVIVFLVFFFTLSGTDNNTAVWISFGAILLSYVVLLCTPLMVRKSSVSTDYRRPLFVSSSAYFLITLIIGVLVMIVQPEKHTATLLINVTLFVLFAIFMLANLLSNEHDADQQAKREEELKYIEELPSIYQIPRINPRTLAKKIEEAYDLISTSPSKSSPAVKPLEDSIIQGIADIEGGDSSTDTVAMMQSIEMIISLATKRNSKLRLEN